jgi:hypothetical protein
MRVKVPRRTNDRTANLYRRWQEYHEQFLADEASRETIVAAYTDWADAVDSVRHEAFEAREGGKLLRWAGIIPDATGDENE